MIKALVFDFGGVITPIEPWDGWEPTTEERDQIKTAISDIARVFEGKLKENNFSVSDFEKEFRARATNLKQEIVEKITSSICVSNRDLLDLISNLSSTYKMYGLVNAPFGWTELRRSIQGLDRYFSRVFVSYEIGIRKPDARIFNYFLENTKLRPEECLFVDDKEENVMAAKNLGMSGYVFDAVIGLTNYLSAQNLKSSI